MCSYVHVGLHYFVMTNKCSIGDGRVTRRNKAVLSLFAFHITLSNVLFCENLFIASYFELKLTWNAATIFILRYKMSTGSDKEWHIFPLTIIVIRCHFWHDITKCERFLQLWMTIWKSIFFVRSCRNFVPGYIAHKKRWRNM